MRKIILTLALLTISLHAELLSFKTLKNEYIKIDNNDGVFSFRNKMYQNRDVLFFFFGTECPHCKREMPYILDLYKNRNTNLEIIGVHGQAVIGDSTLVKYVRNTKIRFNVLSFDDDIKIINHLKQRGMWIGEVPFYVHVDKQGNLHAMKIDGVMKTFQVQTANLN